MPSLADTAAIVGRMATVGGHVVGERARRVRAVDPSEIPASVHGLTPEWLTAVLCGGHAGAVVTGFDVARSSSGTSSRAALRVSYNDAGEAARLPAELFAKSTATWKQRLLLGLGDMLHRETDFFTHVRPRVEMEAPQGYYAAYDERSWRSLCLMEDLAATKGATFYDPETPITPEAMEGLLGTLASMHGTFWESPLFDGELGLLTTPEHFKTKISAMIGMHQRSVAGARRAGELIPAEIRDRQDDLWEAYGRSFELLSAAPMTVLHGDSHIGNTYATADGAMGFADWQVTSKGGWGYDVAYTMTTGLTVEDRRDWEEPLLRSYLERLADAGGPSPAFDDAWMTYRRSAPHAYFAWVFALGQGRLQPAMQPEATSREMIKRTSQALVDLETLAALEL